MANIKVAGRPGAKVSKRARVAEPTPAGRKNSAHSANATEAPAAATARRAPKFVRGGVRAQKSAERRDAILMAALDEFSARGFAATRLDDVAKRANVAKGTIYLHFADKEMLFQEIIRTIVSPVITTLESTALADLPMRAIAERLIDVVIREIYETRRKDVLRLIISEGPRFPAIAEFYYREVLTRVLGAVRGLLARAAERGELASDALVRFPQLLGAPIMLGIIWNSLFERFEPLDIRAFLSAHLDLVFGKGRAA